MQKQFVKIGIWISIVLICNFVLTMVALFIPKGNFLWFGLSLGLNLITITIMWLEFTDLDYDLRLIEGNNKKSRKQEKRILKLKAEKNYLENKKNQEQEIVSLNCQIKVLEGDLKNIIRICVHCNTRIPQKACFCPNCGCEV